MKLFENPFGIHEQAVAVRTNEMELIAANIAMRIHRTLKHVIWIFKKILAASDPAPMAATNARHFGTGETENPNGLVYRVPYNSSVDGNTVEIAVEQAQYGQAAADYQATLQFLENRISGIRKSLRGE